MVYYNALYAALIGMFLTFSPACGMQQDVSNQFRQLITKIDDVIKNPDTTRQKVLQDFINDNPKLPFFSTVTKPFTEQIIKFSTATSDEKIFLNLDMLKQSIFSSYYDSNPNALCPDLMWFAKTLPHDSWEKFTEEKRYIEKSPNHENIFLIMPLLKKYKRQKIEDIDAFNKSFFWGNNMSKTDIKQRLKTICSAASSIKSMYLQGPLDPIYEASKSKVKGFFDTQNQTVTFLEPIFNESGTKRIAVPTNTPISIKNVEKIPQKNGIYLIYFQTYKDKIQPVYVYLQIKSPELTGVPAIAPQEEQTSEVSQVIEQKPESMSPAEWVYTLQRQINTKMQTLAHATLNKASFEQIAQLNQPIKILQSTIVQYLDSEFDNLEKGQASYEEKNHILLKIAIAKALNDFHDISLMLGHSSEKELKQQSARFLFKFINIAATLTKLGDYYDRLLIKHIIEAPVFIEKFLSNYPTNTTDDKFIKLLSEGEHKALIDAYEKIIKILYSQTAPTPEQIVPAIEVQVPKPQTPSESMHVTTEEQLPAPPATKVPAEKIPVPTTSVAATPEIKQAPTPVPTFPSPTPTSESKPWYSQLWDFLYGLFKLFARGGG